MTYLQIQTKFACVTMTLLIVVIILTTPLQFSVTVSAVRNRDGSSEGTILVHFTNASVLVNTSAGCKTLSYTLKIADNQTNEVQVTLSLLRFLVSPLTQP